MTIVSVRDLTARCCESTPYVVRALMPCGRQIQLKKKSDYWGPSSVLKALTFLYDLERLWILYCYHINHFNYMVDSKTVLLLALLMQEVCNGYGIYG